jgi:hypothetical protein
MRQRLIEQHTSQGWVDNSLLDALTALGGAKGANSRGPITTHHLGDQDVAQLFDALALALADRSRTTPDGEASLALLEVMKGRPDLCAKYFAGVPNSLRERSSQAVSDLAGALALAKVGPSYDGSYDKQNTAVQNERARLAGDRDALADEWIAWAKSTSSHCR